jgi:anaerobic magnesium-protoporphyrin IX monomethyl ester cyclase
MKILLVQLLWQRIDKPIYPLGLVCLATALKNRHQVLCLDENMFVKNATADNSAAILLEQALNFQPDVVGLSVRNVDSVAFWDFIVGEANDAFLTMDHLKEIARLLRQNLPNTVQIVGGPAFSIFAKHIMEVIPELDFGVVGEGEITFPLLLDNLSRPDNVPGVFFKRNGSVGQTANGQPLSLPAITNPDYDVMDIKPYIDLEQLDSIGIQSKRGCSQLCDYCVYPLINGRRVRLRDPIQVVNEIEDLIKRHHLKSFQFTDSVFNHPPRHADAICDEIIRRKLKIEWSAWYNIKTLDEESMEKAVEAGCHILELSPDGFSDRTLKAMEKNITKKDIIRICQVARKVPHALIRLNFLCNLPGETIFSLVQLLIFFVRLKLFYRGKVEIHAFNFIRIFPNTVIYQRAMNEGIISPDLELLPDDISDFIKTYYRPRPGSLIEKTYSLMVRFSRFRRSLVGNANTRIKNDIRSRW